LATFVSQMALRTGGQAESVQQHFTF